MGGFRLLPVTLCAVIALFVLKIIGLTTSDGYIFRGRATAQAYKVEASASGAMREQPDADPLAGLESDAVRQAREEVLAPHRIAEASQVKEEEGLRNFGGDVADLLKADKQENNLISFFDPVTQKVYEVSRDDLTAAIDDLAGAQSEDARTGNEAPDNKGDKDAMKPAEEAAQPLEDDLGRPRDVLVDKVENKVSNDNATEMTLLTRLRERSQLIDQQDEGLRMKALSLAAVEKRIDEKIDELKSLKASIESLVDDQNKEAEARINTLVDVYSKMKTKESAAIFDQMEAEEAMTIATRMESRVLSGIIARMSPEKAYKLTVLMLGQSESLRPQPSQELQSLPKIEGFPLEATSGVNNGG